MAVSREISLRVRDLLDNWLPPRLRDSRLLMYPLLWLVFRRQWRDFAGFRPRGLSLSTEDFAATYARTAEVSRLQGETDLNEACTEAVLGALTGRSVLDAGCGRGFLVSRLAERAEQVIGCDIVLPADVPCRDRVTYVRGSVEQLPFADGAFDVVVSTHTLEHVQDIQGALAELRRVARRRLVVVVPRERPYRYGFNLHLHFFPYAWNLEAVLGPGRQGVLTDLGDWFYVEDLDDVRGHG